MNNRFTNQVAVIAGGADGLGKGIAHRIASEGGRVVLFDIKADSLKKTVDEFRAQGYAADGYELDIADENAVKKAFAEVEANCGKISIVINSAGIVGPTNTKIVDYDLKEFDKIYAVNLRGTFLICKHAVAAMEKHGYGRILLIASIAGKEGNPMMVGYSTMKAGVIGLVKSIGKEYAGTGITVNGLAPAVIKTAMNDDTSPEQMEYMIKKIPMNRLGTIDEVASLASWIVSEEASFNTGFVFDISGGRATY